MCFWKSNVSRWATQTTARASNIPTHFSNSFFQNICRLLPTLTEHRPRCRRATRSLGFLERRSLKTEYGETAAAPTKAAAIAAATTTSLVPSTWRPYGTKAWSCSSESGRRLNQSKGKGSDLSSRSRARHRCERVRNTREVYSSLVLERVRLSRRVPPIRTR